MRKLCIIYERINKMRKRFMAALLTLLFVSTVYITASAETEAAEYKLLCTRGACITSSSVLYEGEYRTAVNERFVTTSDSHAVLMGDTHIIDIASGARINAEKNIFLELGVIGVQAVSDESVLYTGTEEAHLSAGGRAVIRVDDYGNTFNYCLKGELKLISTENKKSITLNEGEYVAVTVKRAIRDVRGFEQSDIDKLSISFTERNSCTTDDKTEALPIDTVEHDLSEYGAVRETENDTIFKLVNTSAEAVNGIFYVGGGRCNFEVYNSELEKIGGGNQSKDVNIMANTGDEFYVYIHSDDGTARMLYNKKYVSVYERAFELLKELALPAIVALAAFAVYVVLKEHKKNARKPKF